MSRDIRNHPRAPFLRAHGVVPGGAIPPLIMRLSLMEVSATTSSSLRAKGVRERMGRRHAVPNALLPTMTVTILFSLDRAASWGAHVVIETIFSWPGLGRLT